MFLPENLTDGGVGCWLSCSVLVPGSVGSPEGSVSAQSVMLLIPGLLDRQDELLALPCGTAPYGWGCGRAVGWWSAGMFTGSALLREARVVEASPRGDPLITSSCEVFWELI